MSISSTVSYYRNVLDYRAGVRETVVDNTNVDSLCMLKYNRISRNSCHHYSTALIASKETSTSPTRHSRTN